MRPRSITFFAGAVMALVMMSTAAPAAAVPTSTIAVVHGIPGLLVDACIGDTALKKDFRFGQKSVLRNMLPGPVGNVKLRLAKGYRRCKGPAVLKTGRITLTGGELWTIVAGFKGGRPALRVFDDIATLFPSEAESPSIVDAPLIVRHAAKAGKVDVYATSVFVPTATTPTYGGLGRGQAIGFFAPTTPRVVWLSRPGGIDPIIGPVDRATQSGRTNHYVAVGTKRKGYKLVFFRT